MLRSQCARQAAVRVHSHDDSVLMIVEASRATGHARCGTAGSSTQVVIDALVCCKESFNVANAHRFSKELNFFLNGKEVKLRDVDPEQTLIEFLRSPKVGLTGTKLGCGEGGCGACTVMLSRWNLSTKSADHFSVNACLAPLASVAGLSVTTVEGLGNAQSGLDILQEKFALANGSQCGFCTPGIVMALYSYLRANPKATQLEIEENLDGNLCRCTGYRPILDAARLFGADSTAPESAALRDAFYSRPTKRSELAFPEKLKNFPDLPLMFTGTRTHWYRPTSLADVLALKQEYPHARIVVGNTEVGVEYKFKYARYPVLISPSAVPELNQITVTSTGITVGSAVPFSRLEPILEEQIKLKGANVTQSLRAVLDQLKWFAGNQIRNVASFGGNIATASPISDLNPVLISINASLEITSQKGGKRVVPIGKCDPDFFVEYRKTNLKPEEVLVSVYLPFNHPDDIIRAFKQSRRRDDDIAIVTSCFRLRIDKENHLTDAGIAFGGMGPRTIRCRALENYFIKSKKWEHKAIGGSALRELGADLPLAEDAPGGMVQYRRTLAASMLLKFSIHVNQARGFPIEDYLLSAIEEQHRPISRGQQEYHTDPKMSPVHQPIMHLAADKQVSGEAQYVDDIPRFPRELQAGIIMSTRAHADMVSPIDVSAVKAYPGVEEVMLSSDIAGFGVNQVGTTHVKDEELFAEKYSPNMWYPLGVVLSESATTAQEAARLAKVQWKDRGQPLLTVEDAIKANSFYPTIHTLETGNINEGFKKADRVLEGEMKIGGQEHFYLEPQASLAVPGENDEMTIYSSTQNPSHTQELVAQVLGIPANRVVCKVKRMGGGFGGKETRSIFLSCIAALGAKKTGRPVRLVLDRDVDMVLTGGRHPFLGKWKVGVTKGGHITALDVQLYSNVGSSHDLSQAVMDRALFHSDNVYRIPNLRVTGRLCKTNLPSNTAFRGFGGPQGMMIAEAWMDQIARELNMSQEEVREKNFYKSGEKTHFGQIQPLVQTGRLWHELLKKADYYERTKAVKEFNDRNRYKKRGLSITPTKFGLAFTAKFMNQAGALVHVYHDGSVLVTHGGTEMGQGLHTKMAQVAARAFGIELKDVHISETSTDKVPNTSPTAASVQSDINGMAVLRACEAICARLEPLKKQNPTASWKDLVHKAYFERINLSSNGFYATPDIGYDWATHSGTPFAYFSYGAACTEVEIDVLTGDHTILRSDVIMDVGKSLNPAIDIGQVEGAFVQGAGWTTLEELVWAKNGMLISRGPGAYKIPGFNDVPIEFNVSLLSESPNDKAIHSSKAVGEPPFFLGASVFWAIKDAIRAARDHSDNDKRGSWFDLEAPATAERIRMACLDNLTDGASNNWKEAPSKRAK